MAGYSEYLKLDELLSLQQPRTDHRGTELAFIVVHQVYELWFKLIIEELGSVIGALDDDDLPSTLRHMRRVHDIEHLLIEQLVLIDRLDPGGFTDIRPALGTASAAESRQYATIETLSAPRRGSRNGGATRSIWTSFCAYARRAGFDMPTDDSADSQQRRTRTLVEIYRVERGQLADVCEALLDHDHAFCIWRHRHSLAAARHIGDTRGTGGSSGVAYLERHMSRRFYPDLWSVRSFFEAAVRAS
jgi:tryptophan 2,3-dioxygenase